MNNKTALMIAEEVVRIWENNPELDWKTLIEEFELTCKEMAANKEVII